MNLFSPIPNVLRILLLSSISITCLVNGIVSSQLSIDLRNMGQCGNENSANETDIYRQFEIPKIKHIEYSKSKNLLNVSSFLCIFSKLLREPMEFTLTKGHRTNSKSIQY